MNLKYEAEALLRFAFFEPQDACEWRLPGTS